MRRLKVLVVGPQGVGKTTLIQKLAKNAVSADVGGHTVGLDFGLVEYNGFKIHFFGSPGLQRFSLVRQALALGADGVVLVIDSANFHSVRQGEVYLREIYGNQIPPVIVAANKQDIKGALTPHEVQQLLTFPVHVSPISAQYGIGLDSLLSSFTQLMLRIGKGRDLATFIHNA